MGSTFCCNFQQSSQVAERVTPSLRLATFQSVNLLQVVRKIASCNSTLLDFTIRIGSTLTFLYFDLYLYSAYAAHYVYMYNYSTSWVLQFL